MAIIRAIEAHTVSQTQTHTDSVRGLPLLRVLFLDVSVERRLRGKRLRTHTAFERPLSGVQSAMRHQIVFHLKRLRTEFAAIGSLARVNANVVFEAVRLLKPPFAVHALEGPLIGVHADVLSQIRAPRELFVAELARIRPLGVDDLMDLQIRFVLELLIAVLAFVLLRLGHGDRLGHSLDVLRRATSRARRRYRHDAAQWRLRLLTVAIANFSHGHIGVLRVHCRGRIRTRKRIARRRLPAKGLNIRFRIRNRLQIGQYRLAL